MAEFSGAQFKSHHLESKLNFEHFQSKMLRFSLALLCLSLLALAEDEKAPSSVVLDEKNFKEKVGDEGRYSGNNLTFKFLGGGGPCFCDVLCSLVRNTFCQCSASFIKWDVLINNTC